MTLMMFEIYEDDDGDDYDDDEGGDDRSLVAFKDRKV